MKDRLIELKAWKASPALLDVHSHKILPSLSKLTVIYIKKYNKILNYKDKLKAEAIKLK